MVRKMSMQLLGKELVEQAARPRTYVVRALYALVLFAISATLLHDLLRQGGTDCWNLVGAGRSIVEQLVTLQFFGICLFLPAMLAGAIAGEKERESLALLFLTDMGPWEILLQKYLGRLIPMISFLMLSLPVLAVAYALGGLGTGYLLGVVWSLLLTCLQVGALALLCSVLCRTTVGALVSSYVSLAALYLLTLLLMQMLDSSCYGSYPLFGVKFFRAADLLLCLLPLTILDRGSMSLMYLGLSGLPSLCSTALFLFLARYFLVRRAFTPARNPLLGFFRRMDRIYQGWNKRLGGYTLGRTDGTLPEGEPVAWRELQKRSLGRIQYLVRLGLWIEIPLVGGGIFLLGSSGAEQFFGYLFLGAWVLAALFLTVQGANTIVAERTQQSLEVLLTTTLTSNEIVRQKMRALYRLCLLLAIPLLTVAMGVCVQNYFFRYSFSILNCLLPAVSAVLCVVIYLPMLAWFSMGIGLRVRTRARAILLALLALVLWCVAVPGVLAVLQVYRVIELGDHTPFLSALLLLSPAVGVLTTVVGWDRNGPFHDWALLAMIVNFALYAVILARLRYCCLRHADWWLRQEGKPTRYPSPLKDFST